MVCVQIALWEHTVAEENSYHVPLVQEFDMQGLGKHLSWCSLNPWGAGDMMQLHSSATQSFAGLSVTEFAACAHLGEPAACSGGWPFSALFRYIRCLL